MSENEKPKKPLATDVIANMPRRDARPRFRQSPPATGRTVRVGDLEESHISRAGKAEEVKHATPLGFHPE